MAHDRCRAAQRARGRAAGIYYNISIFSPPTRLREQGLTQDKRVRSHYFSGKRGEGRSRARLLYVVMSDPSRKMRVALGRGRGGDDVRAVDEVVRVLTQHRQLAECGFERRLQLSLVVCRAVSDGEGGEGKRLRTDEGLPLAGGARIAREQAVGLQTELVTEGRRHLALITTGAGEERPAEQSLDEELGVEKLRGSVQRCPGDRRVDVVGSSNSVPASVGRWPVYIREEMKTSTYAARRATA